MPLRRIDQSAAAVTRALAGGYAEDDAHKPVLARKSAPASVSLPDLLPIERAAEVAGVARRTIYNWIAKGLVRTERVASGRIRVVTLSLFKSAARDVA